MKYLLIGGIIMVGLLSLFGKGKEGELPVVDLNLVAENQDGNRVDLNKVAQDSKYLLIYFYPKADTPGCTAQACSIRDAFEELKNKGVKMYGVSSDSSEKLKKFSEKYSLPFDLLSDPEGEIAKAFSVPSRFGFFAREAFLFEGIDLIWHDKSASTRKQAEDVLQVLSDR